MNEDLAKEYAQKYTGSNHPKQPFCHACSTTIAEAYAQAQLRAHNTIGHVTRRVAQANYVYLHNGELCYQARFANGHLSYYHLKCLDENPKFKSNVEARLKHENKAHRGFIVEK